jgi:hypothetical protein
VVVFEFTRPVSVIPGEANAVLAVAADLEVEQRLSKYNVTVDALDAVPRTLGVKVEPGFEGDRDENVNVGAVMS